MAMKAVGYLRVSTAQQGRSGLGLEAQREIVTRFAAGGGCRLIGELVEVESGKRADRPELARALALCRVHGATLVVAKVDRLTRSVGFLHQILASGVEVRFCDLPHLEGPTGRFMLNQMAAVAELEAGLISQRTKAALAACKARGVKLGGDRGHRRQDPTKARAARARRADARALDLAPVVAEIRAAGVTSNAGIARELTGRGIPTPAGRGTWGHQQVANLLARVAA
jgi:DNA invertase Pin-like site-specific DNA recombinase